LFSSFNTCQVVLSLIDQQKYDMSNYFFFDELLIDQ